MGENEEANQKKSKLCNYGAKPLTPPKPIEK